MRAASWRDERYPREQQTYRGSLELGELGLDRFLVVCRDAT